MIPWYAQKTTYAGIGLILAGVGEYFVNKNLPGAIQMILNGFGVIFMRSAINKVVSTGVTA